MTQVLSTNIFTPRNDQTSTVSQLLANMSRDTYNQDAFMSNFNVNNPAEMRALMILLHNNLLDEKGTIVDAPLEPYVLNPMQKLRVAKMLIETEDNSLIEEMMVWFVSHWNQSDDAILKASKELRDRTTWFARLPETRRNNYEVEKAKWAEFIQTQKRNRLEKEMREDFRSANHMTKEVITGHLEDRWSATTSSEKSTDISPISSQPTLTRAERDAWLDIAKRAAPWVPMDSSKCKALPSFPRILIQANRLLQDLFNGDLRIKSRATSKTIDKAPLPRAQPSTTKPQRRLGLSGSPLSSAPPSSSVKPRQAMMKDGFDMGQESEDEDEAISPESSSSSQESLPGSDTEYTGKEVVNEESSSGSDVILSSTKKKACRVGAKRRKTKQTKELHSSDFENMVDLPVRPRTRAASEISRGFFPVDDDEESLQDVRKRARARISMLQTDIMRESVKVDENWKRKPSQLFDMDLESETSKRPRFSRDQSMDTLMLEKAFKPDPNTNDVVENSFTSEKSPTLHSNNRLRFANCFVKEETPDRLVPALTPSRYGFSSTKQSIQNLNATPPFQESPVEKGAPETRLPPMKKSSAKKAQPKITPSKPPAKRPSGAQSSLSTSKPPLKRISAAKRTPQKSSRPPIKNASASSTVSRVSTARGRSRKRNGSVDSFGDEDEDDYDDTPTRKKIKAATKFVDESGDGQTKTATEGLEGEEGTETEKKPRKARTKRARSTRRGSSLEKVVSPCSCFVKFEGNEKDRERVRES